ncbi:putative odorant receptor 19b [Anopheles darlingi]|uniref:putative odorant receptor 19b n=1 Tax=Anopheles darlingi TaxID=43151 RepID=UPI0021001D76|nr:putative odorant receptor 19b [Anopheles darlingi]
MIMIVVPKVAFGYPDVGSLITGMAELVFQINNCVGMLIFPFMFSLWSFCNTLRNENSTMQYFQHMEENFYGLDTRTTFLPSLFVGLLMLPMIYMCGLTGGVKMAMIVNMIGYCAMCFDLISLKLQEVSRTGTHEKEMKKIVKMHQDALECTKLVEKQTSLVLLLQVVLCVLIWSFILLFFTFTGVRNSQSINLLVLFMFDTAETVAYCYSGDVLSSAGSLVAKAVYDVNWESQTAAVQSDLQLILLRAQRPVGVTAGKFSFMSIALFGNGFRNSQSINITVLFLFDTAETVGLCYFGETLFRERPVGVTAGKFTFTNLKLFAGIVQKTYSFYIVLKDAI